MKRRAFVFAAMTASAGARAASAPAALPLVQPKEPTEAAFMQRAYELAEQADRRGDNRFGAVIVKDGRIIGESGSLVSTNKDPTAHGEMEAIRDACRRLGTTHLAGATMYGNARACAMCESGAYWAGLSRLVAGRGLSDSGAPRLGRC